jgi:hypothetical protein
MTRLDVLKIAFHCEQVCALDRIAVRLHRLYEIQCERDWTEREKLMLARLLLKAADIGKTIGCKIYSQSDPRGAALRLGDDEIGPDNYTNYPPLGIKRGAK